MGKNCGAVLGKIYYTGKLFAARRPETACLLGLREQRSPHKTGQATNTTNGLEVGLLVLLPLERGGTETDAEQGQSGFDSSLSSISDLIRMKLAVRSWQRRATDPLAIADCCPPPIFRLPVPLCHGTVKQR